RIKLNRLIAAGTSEQPTEEDAKREETFQEAAERLLKSSTIRSKEYRKGRLRNHVYQAFGSKPVSQIRRGDIRDVLRALVDKGASRQSCAHVKNDISAVLGELWREEMISENVALGVRVPAHAKEDRRERAVLTDNEL